MEGSGGVKMIGGGGGELENAYDQRNKFCKQ